ncbi:MAG: NapH/MauN family ferredoxin-type protein [Alphaproteobacteria bacterium]|nr:NapH/MauN family ferredoxin-type protein [Alphaproteobacteria bacterium]
MRWVKRLAAWLIGLIPIWLIRLILRKLRDLALLLGAEPKRPAPEDMSAAARELTAFKRSPEERKRRKAAIAGERNAPRSNKWRIARWISILLVAALFAFSYWFDMKVVVGALTASQFMGIHLADLNASIQLILADKHLAWNHMLGISLIFVAYLIFGGRSFCSWVCPYHLLSELAEMLHLKLAAKKLVRDHDLDRRLRPVMFAVLALIAFVCGYPLFESVSPVGILSRALTYGLIVGLIWVALLLVVEVVWSRRMWCRYVCPVGLVYGVVGTVTPLRVLYDAEKCLHEGKCRHVCLVPHVLDMTKLGFARDPRTPIGADCTRCSMCIEVCPTGALTFDIFAITRHDDAGEEAEDQAA